MRTANPALSASTFERLDAGYGDEPRLMTVQGTANKTVILLGLALIGAGWTWYLIMNQAAATQAAMPWMLGGLIGGLIFALVTIFKPAWAPVTAPIYAVLEGLFLGGISALFEQRYPGIAIQAVAGTFGVLGCMLLAYKTGLIRATEKFKLGVVAATGGIMLIYLVSFVLSFFGVAVPIIHDASPLGIGFSVVVVIIAALNLVLDFDLIERGAEQGAPRHMEWYGAFALMVTLVWLYIEILRLLAKLRRD